MVAPIGGAALSLQSSDCVQGFEDDIFSVYWEFRLGKQASSQTDLLVSFEQRKAAALAERFRHRGWNEIADFCGAWAQPGSLLAVNVPVMWLEFDGVDTTPSYPSFSFCLERCYGNVESHTELGQCRKLVEAGLRGVPPRDGDDILIDRLFRALEGIQSVHPTRVIHICIMLGRPSAEPKFYLATDRTSVLPVLRAVGWDGCCDTVEYALERYCDASCSEVFLDLGLHSIANGRCGLSLAQQHVFGSLHPDPARRWVLDQCVDDGLCTEAQRTTMLQWPMTRWYEDMAVRGLFHKWLDVKLVIDRNGIVEAKGYAGLAEQVSLFF